jgi:hypothetical protein
MKRKLLHLKSIKTLKSLEKNLKQRYDGVEKNIKKLEIKKIKIWQDIKNVENVIAKKEE